MIPTDMRYSVWLSKDQDDGSVIVVIDATEQSGQTRLVGDRRFECYEDWESIAAWVWRRVSLALDDQRR